MFISLQLKVRHTRKLKYFLSDLTLPLFFILLIFFLLFFKISLNIWRKLMGGKWFSRPQGFGGFLFCFLADLGDEFISLWIVIWIHLGTHIFSSCNWVPIRLTSQTVALLETFLHAPSTNWSIPVRVNLSLLKLHFSEFKLGSRVL